MQACKRQRAVTRAMAEAELQAAGSPMIGSPSSQCPLPLPSGDAKTWEGERRLSWKESGYKCWFGGVSDSSLTQLSHWWIPRGLAFVWHLWITYQSPILTFSCFPFCEFQVSNFSLTLQYKLHVIWPLTLSAWRTHNAASAHCLGSL